MVHMVYFCLLYIFFFKCIESSGARAIFYFRCNAFLVAHTIFYFRCNASLVAHPEKDELLMFGGEYFTGNKVIREHFLFCLYCTSDATLSLISFFLFYSSDSVLYLTCWFCIPETAIWGQPIVQSTFVQLTYCPVNLLSSQHTIMGECCWTRGHWPVLVLKACQHGLGSSTNEWHTYQNEHFLHNTFLHITITFTVLALPTYKHCIQSLQYIYILSSLYQHINISSSLWRHINISSSLWWHINISSSLWQH